MTRGTVEEPEMIEPVDADSRIKVLKPGEAIYSLAGEPHRQVVFQVRERSAVTKYFGETGVEVHAGLFPISGRPVCQAGIRNLVELPWGGKF
jgi:hypothetical protein